MEARDYNSSSTSTSAASENLLTPSSHQQQHHSNKKSSGLKKNLRSGLGASVRNVIRESFRSARLSSKSTSSSLGHHQLIHQQQELLFQQQLSTVARNMTAPSDFQLLKRLDPDVFVACDKITRNHLFSIKLIHLDKLDETDYELVTHELKTCSQLRHRNLLPYLFNFLHLDQLWIITPFCPYTSADRLAKPFGLPEIAIAFIVRDVLSALEYLHQRGLIHRSVRASHILVNPVGRCLLSGLKYSINCISDGRWQPYIHQYPPKAKANLNWFSPELLEQNLYGYNYRSDIYSLGTTCCELANGVVPFNDMQPTEMLLDKLTGNSPRLLDFTCRELVNLDPSEMFDEDREKYYVFRARHFSNSFHTFTSELCLNFDPQKRPTATQLMTHSFIKQLKKSSATSLLDFLDVCQAVDIKTHGATNLPSPSSSFSTNSSKSVSRFSTTPSSMPLSSPNSNQQPQRNTASRKNSSHSDQKSTISTQVKFKESKQRENNRNDSEADQFEL